MEIILNLEKVGFADEVYIKILEDGYLSSNLFEKYDLRINKCFYIGEEKTQEFIDYIIENYEGIQYVYEEEEHPQEGKIMTITNTLKVLQEYPVRNYVTNPNSNTTPAFGGTNTTIPPSYPQN